MTSRRVAKMAQAIREVVSMAILVDLKDPRVRDVTVTHVEVSPDLRSATVHVSVMGDEKQQKLSLYGLESAAGYLQRKIGDRIETRYTPRLRFELDMGVKKSLEVARILKEVLPPEDGGEQAAEDDIPEGDVYEDDFSEDQEEANDEGSPGSGTPEGGSPEGGASDVSDEDRR